MRTILKYTWHGKNNNWTEGVEKFPYFDDSHGLWLNKKTVLFEYSCDEYLGGTPIASKKEREVYWKYVKLCNL